MTREMNKPDWHSKYYASIHCTPLAKKCSICGNDICKYRIRERTLNPDVAEFVNELNRRLNK